MEIWLPTRYGVAREWRIVRPRLDEARWPVLTMTWRGALEDHEVDQHFAEVLEVARAAQRRGQRFSIVMDMRDFGRPTIAQRRYAAARMTLLYEELARALVGVAHFTPSLITRGVLRALYWYAPPPFPTFVTSELAAAIRWAERRVERDTATATP